MSPTPGITSLLEARIPNLRRKSKPEPPPWRDPSPAGDQTYDPYGTLRPFRPTHRTPGVARKKRWKNRPAATTSQPASTPLQKVKTTLQQRVSLRRPFRISPETRQPPLWPLVLLAIALILLTALTSVIYAQVLPKHQTSATAKPTAANERMATTTRTTPGESAGPPLRSPSGDEFRLPVPKSALKIPRIIPDPNVSAIDLPVPVNTAVYAVHDGTARIVDTPRCGTGVVIAGTDGNTYTSCYASQLDIANNVEVKAGDVIMHSGKAPATLTTGTKKTTTALHFEIAVDGATICPQSTVAQWFSGSYASPADAAATGCVSQSLWKRVNQKTSFRLWE